MFRTLSIATAALAMAGGAAAERTASVIEIVETKNCEQIEATLGEYRRRDDAAFNEYLKAYRLMNYVIKNEGPDDERVEQYRDVARRNVNAKTALYELSRVYVEAGIILDCSASTYTEFGARLTHDELKAAGK